jgi:hypothetical protein
VAVLCLERISGVEVGLGLVEGDGRLLADSFDYLPELPVRVGQEVFQILAFHADDDGNGLAMAGDEDST